MTYTEIKDLLSSGFTPEQITTLTTSGVNPSAPEAHADPEPITGPAAVESPAEGTAETTSPAVPDAEETPDNKADPLEEIRQQLHNLQEENKQLKEQIQSNNIRDRTMETVTPPDAARTLAEVIRPTFHNNVESNH